MTSGKRRLSCFAFYVYFERPFLPTILETKTRGMILMLILFPMVIMGGLATYLAVESKNKRAKARA